MLRLSCAEAEAEEEWLGFLFCGLLEIALIAWQSYNCVLESIPLLALDSIVRRNKYQSLHAHEHNRLSSVLCYVLRATYIRYDI